MSAPLPLNGGRPFAPGAKEKHRELRRKLARSAKARLPHPNPVSPSPTLFQSLSSSRSAPLAASVS